MKLTTYRSLPSLRSGVKQFAGRNNSGKITVRHRGSGHKQAVRLIDWSRNSSQGIVVGLEYDPQRNVNIVKLYNKNIKDQNKAYSYIIAPAGIKLFQELNVYNSIIDKNSNQEQSKFAKLLQPGDVAPLHYYEPGDFIHNVEIFPGQGPVFARAAGTFCQVRSLSQDVSSNTTNNNVETSSNWAKVRLPSGSQRLISLQAKATFGSVSIPTSGYKLSNLKKAGRSRWLGWRPSVRGVARNPVDHPHGGGQGKTSGGRPSVTFKSWPTKGQPTRKSKHRNNTLILTSRKRN